MIGQRFTTALLAVIIMVLGVLLGGPENLPRTLSAESIMEVLAPLGLMGATLLNTFGAINNRVQNDENFNPGDLVALTRSREFWTSVMAAIVTGAQLGGLKVIDETQQTLVVDFLLMLSTGLTRTWGTRASGSYSTMIAET